VVCLSGGESLREHAVISRFKRVLCSLALSRVPRCACSTKLTTTSIYRQDIDPLDHHHNDLTASLNATSSSLCGGGRALSPLRSTRRERLIYRSIASANERRQERHHGATVPRLHQSRTPISTASLQLGVTCSTERTPRR